MAKNTNTYITIGELAKQVALPQHIIRYWESEFTWIKPKRINNRRYYTQEGITMILQIKKLLYEDRYTIAGVRNYYTN